MENFKTIGERYGLSEEQVKEEYNKYWRYIYGLFKQPDKAESIVINYFGVFNLNIKIIPNKVRKFKNTYENLKDSKYKEILEKNIDFYKTLMDIWERHQNF